eukprot:COSAG05_NODE_6518_length_944_cov_1.345562_1_plen_148_part_01
MEAADLRCRGQATRPRSKNGKVPPKFTQRGATLAKQGPIGPLEQTAHESDGELQEVEESAATYIQARQRGRTQRRLAAEKKRAAEYRKRKEQAVAAKKRASRSSSSVQPQKTPPPMSQKGSSGAKKAATTATDTASTRKKTRGALLSG